MLYRLATKSDIDKICCFVKDAICEMENHQIFQWDNLYPAKEDFLDDINKQQLFVGIINDDIAVVYVINQECDQEYQDGKWTYPDCTYRVIHRLCVNPAYQNQGIAKLTLSHIEDELRPLGVQSIRLDVFSENPFALSLYLNQGYKQVGFVSWRMGKFYLMEKIL